MSDVRSSQVAGNGSAAPLTPTAPAFTPSSPAITRTTAYALTKGPIPEKPRT